MPAHVIGRNLYTDNHGKFTVPLLGKRYTGKVTIGNWPFFMRYQKFRTHKGRRSFPLEPGRYRMFSNFLDDLNDKVVSAKMHFFYNRLNNMMTVQGIPGSVVKFHGEQWSEAVGIPGLYINQIYTIPSSGLWDVYLTVDHSKGQRAT